MNSGLRSAAPAQSLGAFKCSTRSQIQIPAQTSRIRATKDPSQFGEEAPGTGRRQFPAVQQPPSEEEHDERFDKRTAAEMYQLFEELQRRQGTNGVPAALREVGVRQLPPELDAARNAQFGPGAGKKRRPSAVSSESDEDITAPNQFQMMSTAEVVALWEKMQQ